MKTADGTAPGMTMRSRAGDKHAMPTAFVMNMFYTGLGIARSLGEKGIPVVGLTSRRGIYGNFTRYSRTVVCPDSRNDPEALLDFLIRQGRSQAPGVLFPTRDDDLVFLDRFREQLSPYYNLAIPQSAVLQACLSKWETYLLAKRSGVPTPQCWLIESAEDLRRMLPQITFPCVLKPLNSHLWRLGGNWEAVGARKAIGLYSASELTAEYAVISQAEARAVLQVMVPGGDDQLVIAACYLNNESEWLAGFNTQKILQVPESFGTGCIVSSADLPALFVPTKRLLQDIGFTGIAEVEYKWDAVKGEHMLIEINPRPWDQHRIGNSCGVDLVYLAYCESAGLAVPALTPRAVNVKWVAEDTFLTTALRLLWRRDMKKLSQLFRAARGKRVFAIWSMKDPLPWIIYMATTYMPLLLRMSLRYVRGAWNPKRTSEQNAKEVTYGGSLANR